MSKPKRGPREHPIVAKAIAYMARTGKTAHACHARFGLSRSALYKAAQRRAK